MIQLIKVSRFFLWILILVFTNTSNASNSIELTEKEQKTVIENIIQTVKEHSIYPDKSVKIHNELLKNLDNYKYLGYEDKQYFASKLTKDLQAISFDRHIKVIQRKVEITPKITTSNSINLLDGNVSLVVFDLNSTCKQIDKVFEDVEKSDAIIIDLRDISGGKLETIKYISSYLFKQKTLLFSLNFRSLRKKQKYWTDEHVINNNILNIPIYLLTNSNTSGEAEVFAAILKHKKGAYVVGENTAGNIHPRRYFSIGKELSISIPYVQVDYANQETDTVIPNLLVVSFLAFKESYSMAKYSALEYRVKQGRGTPQETYSLVKEEINYPNWLFFKGQCLIEYRIAEPIFNETTNKYQFPYQVKYYGYENTRVQYQLGNKTGKMIQKVTFKDKDDIKSGISVGFKSPEKLSIYSCKILE